MASKKKATDPTGLERTAISNEEAVDRILAKAMRKVQDLVRKKLEAGKDKALAGKGLVDFEKTVRAFYDSLGVEIGRSIRDGLDEAMKEAYGENYLPSMQLDDVMLSEVYGINMDNVESFIAEAPMISAHVDTFIAIKAKEGKADEVEAELNAYRDDQINNAMQYPMNEAKVKASQVVRKDDYVFFVMLGQIPDETVSDTAAFAKEQIQIGLDKIEELFR